jgi:UDP-N-acetylmuramate--alanine ligase
VLVVTDVYPSREDPIEGITGELVANRARQFGHRDVTYLPEKETICDHLVTVVRPGDLVITLGAGDVWKIGEELVRRLGGERS